MRHRLVTATLFALGLGGWTASAVMLWSAAVLGHDEAQYAIAARDWLTGIPLRWIYLSYGMNAIAAPGVLAGGSERALRVLPIVLGIGFVLAVAHLARRIATTRTAAWLVATIAATLSIAKRSAELLTDLPAALCLILAIALLVDEIDRETGPRWRVVWVAPLFAAAFYIRYGSCIPVTVIGVSASAIGWRAIARRPAPAIATVGLLAALLAPHIAMAIRETGSPLGIISECTSAIHTGSSASLVTYVTSNPFTYYGFTAPVLIAGIVSVTRIRDRRRALLWVIAVLDIVALGLTPIPQARYIFTGITLLALLGVDAIKRAIAGRPARVRTWLGVLAAVALAVSWLYTAVAVYRLAASAETRMASTVLASAAIRRDAGGAACEVLCRHTTQLQWYSGCKAVYEATAESIRHARTYIVIEPHTDFQVDPHELPSPRVITILDRPNVTVTRVDPP